MKTRDAGELVLLAALWGGSFLFMRIGAPEFGPVALVFVRVALAAALLLTLLALRRQMAWLRSHWRPLFVVGTLNSALPFWLFSLAALVLPTGLSGILNATAPLWAAVVAWFWLGERPSTTRWLGLGVGFAGVAFIAAGKGSFAAGEHGVSSAAGIGACLVATLCYGIAATLTRRWLGGVPPLAQATGSQLGASLVSVVPALATWPAALPSARAWWAVAVLAVVCTGVAYLLYFRLIAHIGATQAISVTYLIPAFAIGWGALFLAEPITPTMVIGCAVVLVGTALASGAVKRRPASAAAASDPPP